MILFILSKLPAMQIKILTVYGLGAIYVTPTTHEREFNMVAKGKQRVVLSIDVDVWSTFQENLNKKGYPRGTASWVIQKKLEDLNLEFEALGDSQQLDLMFSRK